MADQDDDLKPNTDDPNTDDAPAADQGASYDEMPGLTLGAGGPAGAEANPEYKPTIRGRIDRFGVAMGTGRRKTSVARVRVKDGSGKIEINGRPLEDYARVERDRHTIVAPLRIANLQDKVDVWVRVEGGGPTGQAGAILLGVARALQARDPGLHHTLSDNGFLTRDARMVERKKYGRKKARRSFQFSKR